MATIVSIHSLLIPPSVKPREATTEWSKKAEASFFVSALSVARARLAQH